MDRRTGIRFFITFIKIFAILFGIMVLLPFIAEQLAHLFNNGVTPGGDSIIVFKDSAAEQELLKKIADMLKKIIIYM